MEETWTVGSVPDDVEDVAERVTSMARLKRRHTQAIETERRLAQKTEALQSTLEALPAVAPAAASASELSSALLGGALQLGGELVSQGWPNARDWDSAWRLGWKRRVDRTTGRVHPGTKSVQGCIRYLKDHRLLQYGGTNVDATRTELEGYRVIIVMRDPEARYVSALQDVFKPRQSAVGGRRAPPSDPSDLHMLSDLDVTCSHCKEQTANSNHWAPQYTSILDSKLPHVDEIICTESLDDDLGHVAHMVNVRSEAVREATWLGGAVDGAKQRKRLAIRPLNFTRHDKGHLRHSTRRMSKDKVFSDRNLDFTDGTGYTFKVDPRMLRLFEGDMRLNPCIRRMRQARAPAG